MSAFSPLRTCRPSSFQLGKVAIGPGWMPRCEALRPREELVADAVVVELLVGVGDDARIGDGGSQQIRKRYGVRGHGPS